MKIALVCRHYTLEKGGLEKYTVFLSRALANLGHEVHVFSNTRMEEPLMVFHHVPVVKLSSPLKHLTFSYLLRQRLRKERFDIVHSMERTFEQDIYRVSDGINPVQMRQRYPNPAIRKLKSIGPRRQVLSLLERIIYERDGCRAVMTNSKLVRDQILRHYAAKPEKIFVIYNGVDAGRFNPEAGKKFREDTRRSLGILSDETVVLFVANDFKLKQLDLVLKALADRKDSSLKLVVAGSDAPGPYRKRAGDYGLSDRVAFAGPCKQIEKLYAAGDVFVLPTLYDAFANVCLEAMACGLPVVTTESNGAAELIEDGEQGYVLKGSGPAELADRLAILGSRERRTNMGIRAARTASAFTPEKHLAEVSKLYERVLSEKSIRAF